MTGTNDKILSPAQVAAEIGVHIDTVREWIRSGKLPAARLGYRTIRIRREDLDAFLGKGGTDPGPTDRR
jgi:excisionase family DNA binding protein